MKKGKDIYRKPGRRYSAEAVIDMVLEAGGVITEPSTPTAESTTPVYAFLDHGRWLGECKLWDAIRARTCKNAQFVDADDPRFFCIICQNVEVTGQWREVMWPTDTDIIEESLVALPTEEQNWTPEG